MYILICLFVWFDSLRPINNLSVIKGRVFLGWTSTKLGLMFLLKDTTQWRRWGSNPRPLGLETSALPLSHCAPVHTGSEASSNFIYCACEKQKLWWVCAYATFAASRCDKNMYHCKYIFWGFNASWPVLVYTGYTNGHLYEISTKLI